MIRNKRKAIAELPVMIYLLNSVLVCIIDTAIVWLLYRMMSVNIVTANTVGVVSGFFIHYLLSSKSVFRTDFGLKGFTVYFTTFLLGLIFADWLIYLGENIIFPELGNDIRFLLSKGISIILPFFVLYFIRKFLFHMLNLKDTRNTTVAKQKDNTITLVSSDQNKTEIKSVDIQS